MSCPSPAYGQAPSPYMNTTWSLFIGSGVKKLPAGGAKSLPLEAARATPDTAASASFRKRLCDATRQSTNGKGWLCSRSAERAIRFNNSRRAASSGELACLMRSTKSRNCDTISSGVAPTTVTSLGCSGSNAIRQDSSCEPGASDKIKWKAVPGDVSDTPLTPSRRVSPSFFSQARDVGHTYRHELCIVGLRSGRGSEYPGTCGR
mmetsp:Transcript_50956/g.115831  ORF Transcript_50956/g.115831 Transcript_50956/m.115831 type:complete len:205 (-) Transcript_50956:374-988(-)